MSTPDTTTAPEASSAMSGSVSVLFLDVDGVLNRCGDSNQGMESGKVALLKMILDATKARVVLSSTWRKEGRNLGRVIKMIEDIGHDLNDATPILDTRTSGVWGSSIWIAPTRGQEIQAWLDKHPNVKRFVILDDDCDMGPLLPHLVNTNSFEGLTPALADEVVRRLNDAVRHAGAACDTTKEP